MKFTCPKCQTRYSIADEKVPADKALRFPCKRCGTAIRLRRKTSAKAAAKGRVKLSDSLPAGDLARSAAPSGTSHLLPDSAGDNEWFVLVGGKQQGPVSRLAVLDMIERQEIDGRTYVWRDGMADWRRLAEIADFGAAAIDLQANLSAGADADGATTAMDMGALRAHIARTRDQDGEAGKATRRATAPVNDASTPILQAGVLNEPHAAAAGRGALPAHTSRTPDHGSGQAGGGGNARRATAPVNIDDMQAGPYTEFGGATAAMDVDALRAHIAKTRDLPRAAGAPARPTEATAPPDDGMELDSGGDSDGATTAMDMGALRAHIAKTRGQGGEDGVLTRATEAAALEAGVEMREPAPSDDDQLSFADSGSVDLLPEAASGDVDLISALSGEPTGERMTRPLSRDRVEKTREPALLPAGLPGSQLGPDGHSGDEAAAAKLTQLVSSVEEGTGERLAGTLGHLGPTFAEADAPGGHALHDGIGDANDGYYTAPPGESTKVFMATAGLFRRRRTHRIAATVGVFASVALVTVVSMDILGVFSIPGMGLVYDMTGLEDPNQERGIERIEEKLQTSDLSDAERLALEARRVKLRGKLVGNTRTGGRVSRPVRRRNAAAGGGKEAEVVREGVKDDGSLAADERDMAESIFKDQTKRESKIDLAAPDRIEAPNLPDGLTPTAILKVITTNSGSMNLCMTESLRKGEVLDGRMDLTLTIAADGSVVGVEIDPPKLRNTVMGGCAKKRIRNWRFPAFNGDPIDVTYPYLLQTSM